MRARDRSLVLALVAACACDGPAGPPPEPPAPAEAPEGPAPCAVVVIEVRATSGEERRLVEQRALVTAELEAGLSDLPGVVAMVENVPPSPGLAGRVETEASRHRLKVRVDQPERESLVVALELCAEGGACEPFAEQSGEDPTPAVAALLHRLAVALGRAPPAGADAAWARSPSSDRYARLIVGRAAASWYRLLPPVPRESLHDRRIDPVERAVFIDPRMALGHWISGRRRFEARDFAGARNAFSRAGLGAPERLIHLADEAAALAAVGQGEAALEAWSLVAQRAPRDPRFAVSRARALIALERTGEAVQLLDGLGPRFQGDARVLELRVAIAEINGGRPQDEGLLEQWQAADPSSPEPVRRRIALLVRAPELARAYALVPELERRGAAEEAARLRLALATSLGRLDEAIAAAEGLGLAEVKAQLLLRVGLERGAAPATLEALGTEPLGRIAVGEAFLRSGDASRALELAEAVLAGEPWLPEALALRAEALARLGRADEAAATAAQLHLADPAWVITSTRAPQAETSTRARP